MKDLRFKMALLLLSALAAVLAAAGGCGGCAAFAPEGEASFGYAGEAAP